MSSSGDELEQPILSDEYDQPAQQPQTQAFPQEKGSDKDEILEAKSAPQNTGVENDNDDHDYEHDAFLYSTPVRPNKYRGPPSTWRNWTASERELVASLDQLEAKDLSLHLYNAFKLNVRMQSRLAFRSQQARKTSWAPPRTWTAWPMPSDIVPREEDNKRWEEDTPIARSHPFSRKRPGDMMRDLLLAQILRKAKERFRKRDFEDVMGKKPKQDKTETTRPQSSGKGDGSEIDEPLDKKPEFMADDERARMILQPTIQHILTKLDDLLMGLHHARSAYLPVDESDIDLENHINDTKISTRKPRKRRRTDSPTGAPVTASETAEPDSSSDQSPIRATRRKSKLAKKLSKSASRNPQGKSFRTRKSRLGLRDWSEILGFASMTGWESTVVKKAAARCSVLFEEGMSFRKLEEGTTAFEDTLYLPGVSAPLIQRHPGASATNEAIDKDEENSEEMMGGVHVDGFLKPIEAKKSWKYSNKPSKKRRIASSCSEE